ncbi:fibronectin type III domain-containing protein [Streptomyces himalayensis]|uniref:fibronectin type III domain-containing protein n=1 Tax=Streptomyces himalayensis TaxID=2820085 RepID=UPI0035A81E03
MRRTPGPALLTAAACTAALMTTVSCGGPARGGRPPSAPTGVTAQAGSATSVHVMWNQANDDSGVIAYEVYRGTTKVKEVPGEQHMVDITGLKPSVGYAFAVRARDADGNTGPLSKKVPVTTPAAVEEDREPPTRPRQVRGQVAGGRAVSLYWSRATDDRGVASYDIYQGTSKIHSTRGGEMSALITGLRPGTTYAFTVRARDAADNTSPASRTVRLTTAAGGDDGRGTAPTGFRATTHREDGAYYIDLSWTPPRTGGAVTEYRIHLDGRLATTLVWGGAAPQDKAEHSFFVTRESGVSYRVRIRARLPDGTWGGFSAERTVTTGADGQPRER